MLHIKRWTTGVINILYSRKCTRDCSHNNIKIHNFIIIVKGMHQQENATRQGDRIEGGVVQVFCRMQAS